MRFKWLGLVLVAAVLAILAAVAVAPDWRNLNKIFSLPPLVLIIVVCVSLAVASALRYRKINFRSWSAEYRDLGLIVAVLVTALVGGIHLIGGVGKLAPAGSTETACRIATLWALAYCAVGFLTGFLFGIPRVLQGDSTPRPATAGSDYAQRVNTNLEQISDWLTKIIVGLGLVELRKVPDRLYEASTWMAQGILSKENPLFAQAASFSNSIIIFFSVTGFLSGYLVTRLFLAGAFRRADVGSETKVSGASKDDAADKLRSFWRPNGKDVDAGNEQKLLEWMKQNGLISSEKRTDIASLIVLPNLAQERAKAVRDLNIG